MIELKFRNVDFCGGRKTRRKTGERINNKLNSRVTQRIEPEVAVVRCELFHPRFPL
jgi:hypothetical protein